MFVKNDSSPEKRYYNGKIGKITAINDRSIEVVGKEDGLKIQVTPEEWTNTRYTLDEETREITETVEGTFKQYPLKTAWAITIHKSQGLTFERAIVDANAAFAHGQVYVALSRCKTFEGLVLSSPVTVRSLVSDGAIDEFVREAEQKEPNKEELQQARQSYFRELLLEQSITRRSGGGYIICTGCWMSSCVGCIPIGWNVTGWREPSVRRNCWRWRNGFRTSWNG